MKKVANKLLSSLLLLAMLLPAVTACSETPVTEESGDTASEPAAEILPAEEEEVPSVVSDDLPEASYDGFTYNILTRVNATNYNFCTEEMNGVALNDAIYERNAAIADRFDVAFTETEYSDQNVPGTYITAGDNTFSLMNVRCSAALTLAMNDQIFNLDEMEYINFEKPYWDAELRRSLSIADKHYFPLGSADLSCIDFMTGILFNKSLRQQYNLEDPYALVNEGKWTFDKHTEMASAVISDLNGDGVMDNKDRYGMVGSAVFVHIGLLYGGDTMMIGKNQDDLLALEIQSEKFQNVFEKVFAVYNDSGAWCRTMDSSNEAVESQEMFRQDQALFFTTQFFFIAAMRDMESDFGILPFPKYDDAQEKYHTRLCFFDSSVIPITASDPEISSVILEALNCASYNAIIPVYYDTVLKGKYSRDVESTAMIDLMMNTRVVDLGDTIFVDLLRNAFVVGMYQQDNRDLASEVKKREKMINKEIQKINDVFLNNAAAE